jgi:hypothetical protein
MSRRFMLLLTYHGYKGLDIIPYFPLYRHNGYTAHTDIFGTYTIYSSSINTVSVTVFVCLVIIVFRVRKNFEF